MLYGDTPRPKITSRAVPGTTDLFLVVVQSRQTNQRFASFHRLISGSGPQQFEILQVDVQTQGNDVHFDLDALEHAYGRQIDSLGPPPLSGEPELAPVTPAEYVLVHNLRELGASPTQIWVALLNHRNNDDDEASLRAALFERGASLSEIDAILRAAREARRAETDPAGPLTPSGIEDIFGDLARAEPNATIGPTSQNWASLPESIVLSDSATRAAANPIIAEIRTLDPTYEPPQLLSLGLAGSQDARSDYINKVRFDRAVAIYQVQGDYRPLQAEILRFMQMEVDLAHDVGLTKLGEGRLPVRLHDQEALGNYIDGRVRKNARERFTAHGLEWSDSEEVRIQRREYDTSGTDITYRIPDIAIGNVMFDATITRKLPQHAQIRGYFSADARPIAVIIVRPTALGGSYVIMPPRAPDPTR